MSIFIHYVDKALILGRLINFLVTGKAEIKAQVCWLQKTCSKSLYGTFPNTLNHIACTEGNSFRLKVCLTRGDTNENYDKTFRLEWLSTTWDVIAAIKLWEKPDNTGRIIAIDPDELRSERVCCWLSKMSAGHKHHTKWFRIMTNRVVQEVGKTTRKSQWILMKHSQIAQGWSKVGCFHLPRAPIHFSYGPGSTQSFERFYKWIVGKAGNREYGLKTLKSTL